MSLHLVLFKVYLNSLVVKQNLIDEFVFMQVESFVRSC